MGVQTKLFYKSSTRFNVTNNNFSGFSDDNAIATDKTAYRPGTDNHIAMVVSRRQASGPSVVGSTTRLWCALL